MVGLIGEPIGVKGLALVFGFEGGKGFVGEKFSEFLGEGFLEIIVDVEGRPGIWRVRVCGAITKGRIGRWWCNLGSMVKLAAS